MSLELRQMRHLLAVADHGNFSRAAMVLQLSQPALSRSIQGIEDEVGAKLFLRSATGVAPTDIGRLLIQRTRQVVQMAEAVDRDIGSDLTLQAGQVVVGSGPLPVATSLGTAVGQFINLYRKTSVRLEVGNWDDLLPRLRARELDFFVAEISTLEQEHDLDIEPTVEHPVFSPVGQAIRWPVGSLRISSAATSGTTVEARIPLGVVLSPATQIRKEPRPHGATDNP